MRDPAFGFRFDLPLHEERELAYVRLRHLCQQGLWSVKDFLGDNPYRIFAAHEVAGIADGSMATKMTVQFNLFGGTVLKLGTARHHRPLLDAIDRFDQVGCFALTELGYGNNAVEMETQAVYDPASDELVVHTPSTVRAKQPTWSNRSMASRRGRWCRAVPSFSTVPPKRLNCTVILVAMLPSAMPATSWAAKMRYGLSPRKSFTLQSPCWHRCRSLT